MRNKKSVIFMGTPDFAVPSLEKIHKEYHVLSIYTQPPKKSGRGLRTKLNPIHEISNDYLYHNQNWGFLQLLCKKTNLF